MLPSKTLPLPCEFPNPAPVMVTDVPGAPDTGLTAEICGVFIVNGVALLMTPF
jgi:hypothetical protein